MAICSNDIDKLPRSSMMALFYDYPLPNWHRGYKKSNINYPTRASPENMKVSFEHDDGLLFAEESSYGKTWVVLSNDNVYNKDSLIDFVCKY